MSKGRSSTALALLDGVLGRGFWQDREVSSKARCSPCDSYIRISRVTKEIDANFHGQSTSSKCPDVNAVLDDYLATEGYPTRTISLWKDKCAINSLGLPYGQHA